MKNVTSIKSVKTESPKTPGGISKSLLTPCRRVGLSRNWKKAGPSPFVSPLAGSSTPSTLSKEVVQTEKKVSRKRKERVKSEDLDEEKQCTPETTFSNDGSVDVDESAIHVRSEDKGDDLSSTPTRHIEVPHKKKSKTLLSAINKHNFPKEPLVEKQIVTNVEDDVNGKDIEVETDKQEEKEIPVTPLSKSRSKGVKCSSKKSNEKLSNDVVKPSKDAKSSDIQHLEVPKTENVVTPVQKSKSKCKSNISINKTNSENPKIVDNIEKENILQANDKCKEIETDLKPRSPNELTKECIVVIQKKIFKTDRKLKEKAKPQLFDSDSDDVPLGQLNKGTQDEQKTSGKPIELPEKNPEISIDKDVINLVDDEEDFIETKRSKVKKLADKATSIGGLKKLKTIKQKIPPSKPTQQIQNTDFDDEDDFDFDNKKTILIRKSYDKVIKPLKAKSTGSITQKDIDELRARIEAKKKMLLARAMTEDTVELRTLIKKWQRGCQEALMELMELMKTKFADRQNMDYSEILSMLKIPQTLVGYDAENDCFITPDDSTIILTKLNDS